MSVPNYHWSLYRHLAALIKTRLRVENIEKVPPHAYIECKPKKKTFAKLRAWLNDSRV